MAVERSFAMESVNSSFNNYGHKLLLRLKSMKAMEQFCDVEIIVQGEHILCHKVVLASASEYFENMFRHSFKENSEAVSRINLDSNPLIPKEISGTVVKAVIDFLYSGYISNSTCDDDNLPDIFCLAHQWLLEDLVNTCTKMMSQRISTSNVFQLLDFANQYGNDQLDSCAKRFLATNLPSLLVREEFKTVDQAVMSEVFSDPIIFCHDDDAWLSAVQAWSADCEGDSEARLKTLFNVIPLHLLASEEKERIMKDKSLSASTRGYIEKSAEDTEITKSVVQYIPTDMFTLNEEPGWLMHTMKDRIVIERMEQFCKTDEHDHLSRGGVERAMQAFYGSKCYMFFESECPASNNRYIGDDHQHDQCSKTVKHLWSYNVIKKEWSKKLIILRDTDASWDFDCLVCDFQVSLHMQGSTLFCFLVGKEREMLLKTELEGDDSTWQLLTTSSVVERMDTDIHPRLYTSTIIRVTDHCIWFHGKADWDEEAKCGVFTMTFNHVVTFKIVVCPSLEIVIADFYQTSSNQMVMLTHEKHPKPRLFEVVKHNYELALHDLSTGAREESSLNIDLLGVKGVFLNQDDLHFICVKDDKPVQLRNEQETVSKTYNIKTKVWQDRVITSLTNDSILFFKDSELGSTAFSVPYNLMYRKQYLTEWQQEGSVGEDGQWQDGSSDSHTDTVNLVPGVYQSDSESSEDE